MTMKSNVTVKLATLFLAIALLFLPVVQLLANPGKGKPAKPFRIHMSGKQVTIKCSKDIKSLMVWTSGGHRLVEQKDIDAGNFTFKVDVKASTLYLMLRFSDDKTYSEKIGL